MHYLTLFDEAKAADLLTEEVVEVPAAAGFRAGANCWTQIEPGQDVSFAGDARIDANGRAALIRGCTLGFITTQASVRLRVWQIRDPEKLWLLTRRRARS